MKEIDCSTINICIDDDYIRETKAYDNDEETYMHGYFQRSDREIYLFCNSNASLDSIVATISHESIHKIIFELIGQDECGYLDEYLKYIGVYQNGDIDYSGVKLR